MKIDKLMFEKFGNNNIFARGHDVERKVFWVAVKGAIEDWALYMLDDGIKRRFDHEDAMFQHIKDWGVKSHSEETIRDLVPVTDEVFKLYRH